MMVFLSFETDVTDMNTKMKAAVLLYGEMILEDIVVSVLMLWSDYCDVCYSSGILCMNIQRVFIIFLIFFVFWSESGKKEKRIRVSAATV